MGLFGLFRGGLFGLVQLYSKGCLDGPQLNGQFANVRKRLGFTEYSQHFLQRRQPMIVLITCGFGVLRFSTQYRIAAAPTPMAISPPSTAPITIGIKSEIIYQSHNNYSANTSFTEKEI